MPYKRRLLMIASFIGVLFVAHAAGKAHADRPSDIIINVCNNIEKEPSALSLGCRVAEPTDIRMIVVHTKLPPRLALRWCQDTARQLSVLGFNYKPMWHIALTEVPDQPPRVVCPVIPQLP